MTDTKPSCRVLVLASNPEYVHSFIDTFEGLGDFELYGVIANPREPGYDPSVLRGEVNNINPHLVITGDLTLPDSLDRSKFAIPVSNPYVLAAHGQDHLRIAFLSGRWPPRKEKKHMVLVIEV